MSLQTLCGLFGYSRQAYYKHLRINSKHSLEEEVVLERIHSYRKLMPRIGGTKLHYLMNKAGYRISRKTLFSILRTNSLLVRGRKKYAVTTDSRHWMKKYPNLIRGFDFDLPNLLWVSDITYMRVKGEFAYLSLITDAYSHKIVGYCLYHTLESEGTIMALQMAIEATPENKRIGLIHHSDRGSQYCCNDYVKLVLLQK
ncbi:hypothetical protein EZS27_036434 [termite gut metagenome]|uniref:Integrase catalytic domain-containing protein n=1 Tax=termite gut metagenome TaxID=433724 RepID=A0A5J4PVP2_9ZZZZ